MTPAALNLRIYQGANFGPVSIYCQDANGNAVNITGWNINSQVREVNPCGKGALVFDFAPTLGNAQNGEIVLARNAATTANDPQGAFAWDLVPTNSSGAILGPLVAGRVIVVPMQTQVL